VQSPFVVFPHLVGHLSIALCFQRLGRFQATGNPGAEVVDRFVGRQPLGARLDGADPRVLFSFDSQLFVHRAVECRRVRDRWRAGGGVFDSNLKPIVKRPEEFIAPIDAANASDGFIGSRFSNPAEAVSADVVQATQVQYYGDSLGGTQALPGKSQTKNQTGHRPGPLDQLEGVVLGYHVRKVFFCWIIVFGLVGAQMGWVLRPFIGAPNTEFSWFRVRSSNFFEAVASTIYNLMF